MSVNKVILMGNIGADPEIRESQGGKFATMRLATTQKAYTRKDGLQVPERTEWHSLVANGSVVQVIEQYVRKGTKLYVEGELRSRTYTDRNGQERYVTEVYVRDLELCGGRPPQQDTQQYQSPYQPQAAPQSPAQGSMLFPPEQPKTAGEEDIPF